MHSNLFLFKSQEHLVSKVRRMNTKWFKVTVIASNIVLSLHGGSLYIPFNINKFLEMIQGVVV